MKAIVLDGASALRDLAETMNAALRAELTARGYEVAHRPLAGLEIPPCKGDFGCWTVSPGLCVQPGPHRELLREIVCSDLVVWVTPVTFGGHSSELKRLLDHLLPLLTPLMARFAGETHHPGRYPRFPDLLALGITERADAEAAAVFHRLVHRNALNFHPRRFASGIAERSGVPAMARWVAAQLEGLAAPPRPAAAPLDLGPRPGLPATPPQRALVFSASPRGSASISGALAADLASALAGRGVRATTADLHLELRRDPGLERVAAELARAEVVALVAPLYVDGLPAPAIRGLELLAPTLQGRRSRARFTAVVQCGFPEALHTDTALAICRCFAAEAGLDWIGGLGVGGGGMLAPGPLADQGGRARNLARALDLTAAAIARGEPVPAEAQGLARRSPIPAWLYRKIADWGFRREARRHGVSRALEARPDA